MANQPSSHGPGPEPAPRAARPAPEGPNPFGPDAPNVRDDEPPPDGAIPLAEPPKPPRTALDDDDFAPDEG